MRAAHRDGIRIRTLVIDVADSEAKNPSAAQLVYAGRIDLPDPDLSHV